MNEPDRFSIAVIRIFLLKGRTHMNHNQASDGTNSQTIFKTDGVIGVSTEPR